MFILPKYSKIGFDTSSYIPWRIHGAGILMLTAASMTVVYWWDPCYHIYQHHGSVMGNIIITLNWHHSHNLSHGRLPWNPHEITNILSWIITVLFKIPWYLHVSCINPMKSPFFFLESLLFSFKSRSKSALFLWKKDIPQPRTQQHSLKSPDPGLVVQSKLTFSSAFREGEAKAALRPDLARSVAEIRGGNDTFPELSLNNNTT